MPEEHNLVAVRFRFVVDDVRGLKSQYLEFQGKGGTEKRTGEEVDRRACDDCCILVTDITPAEAANAAA